METPPMTEKRQLTDPAGEEFCLLPTSGVAAQRTVSTYPRDDRGAQQLWAPDTERPDQERARASYGSVGAVPQYEHGAVTIISFIFHKVVQRQF